MFRKFGWSIQAINGLPREEVIRVLQKSLIFLTPIILKDLDSLCRAACCSCYLIGYSGLGGRELLHLASGNHAGQEVAYGDWLGFVQACMKLNERLNSNQSELVNSLLHNSIATRESYSSQKMIESVQTALNRWEAQLV